MNKRLRKKRVVGWVDKTDFELAGSKDMIIDAIYLPNLKDKKSLFSYNQTPIKVRITIEEV
jgi:hypothetical protein